MGSRAAQRDDIQGLRALAVLAVILFHFNSDWLPGGFVGVDVFLVISGYLITTIVLRNLERGSFSFLHFYIARVRRIVPAYMVLLAMTSLVMAVLLIPRDFETFKESLKEALYFNSNNYFASHNDYFAPDSHELPLLHTWSLAVEMQFYLLLPAVLVFVPRRFLPWLLTAVALLLLGFSAYQLAGGQSHSVYFSLAARIPEFLVGSLLAFGGFGATWSRRTSNTVAVLGLLMVLGSFWFITEHAPFPGLLALPACIGVAMLIATRNSVCNQVLSSGSLVRIGALSYSLYLWHWPILASFRYFFESYYLTNTVIVVALLLTFALSYISYHLVEVPFRNRSFSLEKVPRYAALVVFVPAAIGVAGLLNSKLVEPLPDKLTRYALQSEICHGKVLDSCTRGESVADKNLLLMGDSHAAQLNYFADVVGEELSVRFEVVTASSCVPIEGFDIERISEFAHDPCRGQIEEAAKRLGQVDGVVLAGMWSYHTRSETFIDSLSGFLDKVQSMNKPLLVLSQVPMLEGNVQRIQRFNVLGFPRASGKNNEWQLANDRVESLVNDYANTYFLDLSTLNFFERAPFNGDDVIYFDSHHLNEVGSRKYGRTAIPFIEEWIQEAL
ncbi:peptidoglycan/LPS O-acetylase OafA/YrhL [Halomonas fontilapidosi]|uniref:Peptidoglycan/LPS O-acetylase OafA/YrhL n=1 Tax=Halomonas fontilapidosi TaxID=616675 RepID=A0A7W5DNC7_9GAMM|nr:acyltransferase family protein [Halomonas fontilapidosi]MBB3185775.1 peptidoglycan/LPS O-acetylase OafA/YrhL [Halomonas fontilapidosi]